MEYREKYKVGDFTPIDSDIYAIMIIEWPFLRLRMPSGRGPYRTLHYSKVGYFEEGKLKFPEYERPKEYNHNGKININKLIREETDMTVSRELVEFAHEHILTLICQLAGIAAHNAKHKGDKRLRPAHWYRLELSPNQGLGYYKANDDYIVKVHKE